MRWLLCGTFVLMAAAAAAQQAPGPPRAPGPPPPGTQTVTPSVNRAARPTTGTARVRGRVLTDDGAPIRDADVTLSGDVIREAKSDGNGRYELTDLPPGRFTITANKAGYFNSATLIPSTIATTAANPAFEIADGSIEERTVTLSRGGIITGHLVDDFGEPVVNAEVRVERYVWGPGGRQLAQQQSNGGPATLTTDDRGEYRIFGLPAGEYLVSARSRQFGAPVTMGGGGARDRAEGLLPTYFPGTTRIADAQAIRVATGQEVTAHFAAVPGRLVRISGTAHTASGAPAAGLNVFLGVETSFSSGQINGGPVSPDGSFSVGNVPPGDFVLRVRAAGAASPGTEVASMPITVSTEDITGLRITTRRGATIKGRVDWQGESPRPASPVRISTRSAEWSRGPLAGESTITYLDTEAGTVREDDTFELGGIVGSILFSASAAQPWLLKSVTFRGTDVTSTGVDAWSLEGNAQVVITMTDKVTEVTGSVRDAQQRPVTDYLIVLLPQQPMVGMGAARLTRLLRPDQAGAFRVRGLPAGNYVAAAVTSIESGREWDPAIQKSVRSSGQAFTLSDGETMTLALELLR